MPTEIDATMVLLLCVCPAGTALLLLLYALLVRMMSEESDHDPVWTPEFNPPARKVDDDGNEYSPPVVLTKFNKNAGIHSCVVAQFLNDKWVDFETCTPITDAPRFWMPIEIDENIETKYSLALAAEQRRIAAARKSQPITPRR